MTLYGARNVEIFLGSLPTGRTCATPMACSTRMIGLLVTNADRRPDQVDLGVGDGTGALCVVYAYGEAALVGVDGLTISGAITVRMNSSGRAIDRSSCCRRPGGHGAGGQQWPDDDGDGLIDETGEQAAVRVKFATAPRPRTSRGLQRAGEIDRIPRSRSVQRVSSRCQRCGVVRAHADRPSMSTCRRRPSRSRSRTTPAGCRRHSACPARRALPGGPDGFRWRTSGSAAIRSSAGRDDRRAGFLAARADRRPRQSDLDGDRQHQQPDLPGVTYRDVNRVGLNDASILDRLPSSW